MPSFVRIDLYDKLACQTPTRLGTLYADDLLEARDVLAIDDQESLTFSFSRLNSLGDVRAVAGTLVARSIARVVWDDGSFDERRVALIQDGRGDNAGTITVTANPLLVDLAEGADSSTGKGFVSVVTNCLRVFDFSTAGLTATQVWDTYIIPACPSWVTKGTIDPTAVIPDLSWNRLTPLALALQTRDALRRSNIDCELRLRRNGSTDYKLDLVTKIGSSATVPIFHPRTSLKSLRRTLDATQQATRVFVIGETDPGGFPGIPGRARWKVTNVDGGNKKLTLADPNGGAGPIGMTNQWVNAYVLRVLTGRTFQIQASDFANQTVTLLDVSTFAVDEVIELRLTEPGTNTRTSGTTRFAISSVSINNLTLSGDPIAVDGQFVDWYAKVWTASSGGSVVGTPQRISATTASTDVITVASGAGFNNTHFVEFIQTDGAGEIPSYLEHATFVQAPPTGYGVKCADLGVSNVFGVTDIGPNPFMRVWTNSANPPDGWRQTGGGGRSQNSNPSFTRYGGFSAAFSDFQNVSFWSPRFDIPYAPGNDRVSVRAFVYLTLFSTGAATLGFTLTALDKNGDPAIGGSMGSASLTAGAALNQWLTVEIKAGQAPAGGMPFGAALRITGPSTASITAGYIDSVEVYAFTDNPEGVYEFGDATALHQSGNRYLTDNGSPPASYELTIADMERDEPTDWSRNLLTIGGNVRAVDSDFGIDATVRLLRLERDLLRPKNSLLGLSTLKTRLTQL